MPWNVDREFVPEHLLYSHKYFKRLRSWEYFGKKTLPLFGSIYANAANAFTYPVPQLKSRDFVTWSDTMPKELGRKGGPSSEKTGGIKSGYGNAMKPDNPQFVSVVRHHGSSFGKKKRYTLKKMKRELRANDVQIKSRFQTFQSNGFQTGLGGRILSFGTPASDTQAGTFPFHIWDVTSMPVSYQSGVLVDKPVLPCRGYQLAYTTTNFTAREYSKFGWIPMLAVNKGVGSNLKLTAGGDFGTTNCNIAVPTEKTGAYINATNIAGTTVESPYSAGFKHDWSDIQLVLYPQTGLPTKWHVALISFPDTLCHNGYNPAGGFALESAGPNRYMYDTHLTSVEYGNNDEYYSAERTANYAGHDNMDLRWQKFWSGKLQNPINRDEAGVGTMHPANAQLPFKIIEHESFYQPARDNPSFGGTAQRLIKKLFYRRDWTFPPSVGVGSAAAQGDALNNLDTIQLHANSVPNVKMQSSPFSSNSENVYLAIWAEHYNSFITNTDLDGLKGAPQPGANNLPSYDLVVRMKHTLNTTQQSINKGVARPDGP